MLDIIQVRSYLRTAHTTLYPDDKKTIRQTTCAMLKILLDGEVDSVIKRFQIRLQAHRQRPHGKSGAQWTMDIADAVLKFRTIKANRHRSPYQEIRKHTAKLILHNTPLPNAACPPTFWECTHSWQSYLGGLIYGMVADFMGKDVAERSLFAGTICVVSVSTMLYWLACYLSVPGSSLLVAANYRGDMDHMLVVAALSRLQLGEFAVSELMDQGIRVIQLPHVLYAIFFRIGGIPGLIVADGAMGALFAVMAWLLLRRGVRLPVSLAVLGVLLIASAAFQPVFLPWITGRFVLWELRFPRPLITGIALAAVLYSLLRIWRKDFQLSVKAWIWMGAWCAVLWQGDMFSMYPLIVGILFTGFIISWRHREALGKVIRMWAFSGLTFLILSVPTIVGLGNMSPDYARRYGQIDVGRWPLIWFPSGTGQFWLTIGVAAMVAGCLRFIPDSQRRPRWRMLAGLNLLVLISYWGMTIGALLTGITIQPYHSLDSFFYYSSASLLISCFMLFHVLMERAMTCSKSRIIHIMPRKVISIALTLLMMVFIAYAWGAHSAKFERPHLSAGQDIQGYERAFAQLLRELSLPRYSEYETVLTFDRQVHNYWIVYRGGTVFIPHAWATMVSDAAIEARLVLAGKVLGLDEKAWILHLLRDHVIVQFWGHAKYQANRHYMFAHDLKDYLPEEQEKIKRRTIYDTWEPAVPIYEAQRMLALYRSTTFSVDEMPKLDMIIVQRGNYKSPLDPPKQFEKCYENEVFTVYRKSP